MIVEQLLPAARARLVTVSTDVPVTRLAALLSGEHDLVVVCEPSGAMAGVVSKTDLVRLLKECHVDVCGQRASVAMTTQVTYCRPGDPLHEVWSLMTERGFRHVPVIDGEARPVGVLNARDALQALLAHATDEAALLRDYVMGVGYR